MLTSNFGVALAGLTAWGLYGYLFSREHIVPRRTAPSATKDRELCGAIRAHLVTTGVASNPRAIHVRAENGYVTLTGDVFCSELDAVMAAVRTMPLVKGVRNRLHQHRSAVGVSALQGRPYPAD